MTNQQPSPAEVGSMYDQFTDIFAQNFGGNLHFGYWESEKDDSPIETTTERLTDLVADRLALAGAGRVLDVGCGNGKASVQISTGRGLHVVGITISDHQLQLARARPYGEGLPGRASFHLADAMELPFEDSSFDGAYAIESIAYMRDKNAVFSHLARVLRPGARLVMTDVYQNGKISGEDADHMVQANRVFRLSSLITADMYREYAHRAGLQLVEFMDISENVLRSYDYFADACHQIAITVGGETSSQMKNIAHFLKQIGGPIPQVCYMLLTAVRP